MSDRCQTERSVPINDSQGQLEIGSGVAVVRDGERNAYGHRALVSAKPGCNVYYWVDSLVIIATSITVDIV
jgi:hypothetical protein